MPGDGFAVRTNINQHSNRAWCRAGGIAPFVLCEESDRLLHEYNNAVLEVSRAVGALADLAGTSSGADYQLLSRETERAKARLEKAQSAYERHVTEHGCGERTTTRK